MVTILHRQLILSILSFVFFSYGESPNSIPQRNTIPKSANGIHLAINVTNHHDISHSNNSANLTKITEQPYSNESQFLNKISELYQKQGSHFLSANKWYLLTAALACSYCYLVYFIMSGNSYLGDNTLWSSWHQELPLDQLLAIPQQNIMQELIGEIQRRYIDASSIADIVKPLGVFIVKIEQEEEQIKWYQYIYSWLLYARLTKLVPLSQQRFAKIPERLQRIAYYKNLFKSWAADYQLQQAERMWYRCPENEPDLGQMDQLLQVEMRLKTFEYWLKREQKLVPNFN